MQRFGVFGLMISPLSLLVAFGLGCGGNDPYVPPKKFVPPAPVKRTALEAKGLDGVVTGKVVFDGDPKPLVFITRIDDHPDKAGCRMGGLAETSDQSWMVNRDTKALANVVMWLEPPRGKYFSLSEKDQDRHGEVVVMDEPHCAFVPHVVAVYPSYFDGAKQVKTGQKFQVKNSAPFLHSIQWSSTRENDAVNANIPANGGHLEFVLNPEKSCLAIGCGIHNWMHGIVWIFEHPYHAVTREDGTFEIKNVPTDVELTFVAWHESNINPFLKQKMTFQKGANAPIELKHKK